MAIESATKYKILRHLGWPLRTIDPTSTGYSKYISDQLDLFPEDATDLLTELLERIDSIEAQRSALVSRSNVKSVDDIEFFEDGASAVRAEKRNVIKELACLMDLPLGPGARGSSMGNVSI